MFNSKTFFKSTLILAFFTLISKILGLFRQQYSLYLFGADWQFDAFVAAYRIPNALRELLAEGALSAAFIPIFSSLLASQHKTYAFLFAKKILLISFLLTTSISCLAYFSSHLFIPFYHSNPLFPQASTLTTSLFNIFLFYLPFINLAAILMGILNSLQNFLVPALGPLISNLSFLLFLSLTHQFHQNLHIHSLAYATILGGLSYALIQIPSLLKYYPQTHTPYPPPHIKPYIQQFFSLFLLYALAMGIPKLNMIFSNFFSDSITGANTSLSQAFFLIQIPISLFVVSISTISLPNLSKAFQNQNFPQFQNIILLSSHSILFFLLPTSFAFLFLHHQFSQLIFQDILTLLFQNHPKHLNPKLIQNIAQTLLFLTPSILPISFSILLLRIFQASKNIQPIILSSTLSFLFHASSILSFHSLNLLSLKTIALSSSLSSLVYCSSLLFNLKSSLPFPIPFKSIFLSQNTLKILASSSLMITSILLLQTLQTFLPLPNTPLSHSIYTLSLILTGSIVYFISSSLLKTPNPLQNLLPRSQNTLKN